MVKSSTKYTNVLEFKYRYSTKLLVKYKYLLYISTMINKRFCTTKVTYLKCTYVKKTKQKKSVFFVALFGYESFF